MVRLFKSGAASLLALVLAPQQTLLPSVGEAPERPRAKATSGGPERALEPVTGPQTLRVGHRLDVVPVPELPDWAPEMPPTALEGMARQRDGTATQSTQCPVEVRALVRADAPNQSFALVAWRGAPDESELVHVGDVIAHGEHRLQVKRLDAGAVYLHAAGQRYVCGLDAP